MSEAMGSPPNHRLVVGQSPLQERNSGGKRSHLRPRQSAAPQKHDAGAAQLAAKLRKAVPIAKGGGRNGGWDERAESLIDACTESDLASLRGLLALRIDVNYVDEDGYSPLVYAATANFAAGVKELCRAGADVNHTSHLDGSTALHVASQNGFLGIVKFLLLQGAMIPEADDELRDDENDFSSQV